MKKQGLYDPKYEHDACGIGFIANVKGSKSHSIVSDSLKILHNLDHRGASGADQNTGDGAGILTQIPHSFFEKISLSLGFVLPEIKNYAVGMVFLPMDEVESSKAKSLIDWIIAEEGLSVIFWRDVPVDSSSLGESAVNSMPKISQVFIRRTEDLNDELDYERRLYVIRKRIEKKAKKRQIDLYIASFSSRTIVYKGMLTPTQLEDFFPDISDSDYKSAIAMVHSRFSTNTFPSWQRAHPNRYIIHNGEINTIRGNLNWMNARQHTLESELLGRDLKRILPLIDPDGSDSSMFDNCLEFLHLSGRPLSHVMMMMIPEPWTKHETMDDDLKAFYEYHSCLIQPWDGPAAICFSDGTSIGGVLDRNGLRPARYYVTNDDRVILASEVGVLDIPPEDIVKKGRISPGHMFLVDTNEGRLISNEEIKSYYSKQFPYRKWLVENLLNFEKLPMIAKLEQPQHYLLISRLKAFGYTYEDLRFIISPMAKKGEEQLGSMGTDIPLAILSDKPQVLYNYFKQLFSQVTNPPLDAIREEVITSCEAFIGTDGNLITTDPINCRLIKIKTPVIDNEGLARLKGMDKEGFKSVVIPMLLDKNNPNLENALEKLFDSADREVSNGTNILILSDRGVDQNYAAIPALLAVAGLHHHLIRRGTRAKVALVVESGEPREVHHFSLLLGYGASAINPYLPFETIKDMIHQGFLTDITYERAVANYLKASIKGIVKVLSKMGISTIQSYHGAQIFEAIGLSKDVVQKYFTQTPSRIEGIGLDIIQKETLERHKKAFDKRDVNHTTLDSGGFYQYRQDGEKHIFTPETIHLLQTACRTNDYNLFKEYSSRINDEPDVKHSIRGVLKFKKDKEKIPLSEVESVENIVKRFKTGAMSYGSISKEAHQSLAIAMNRLGAKSNTGEGGEEPERFYPLENGDSRNSAIKQIASGRFGVTSEYLVNAKELQIKMAQGAKPGEGGQLPGNKVYPWVAKTRNSTPGVALISPPPHHDIYSIEDLSQLIHDLKNANTDARVNVKLVSEVGVGTVAAGVAKAKADVVLVSGYDGGTGASPRTSIMHAGLPWELGLSETHQTLLLNNLRSRISVEVDGKLLTGRDVVIAAILGAEEFGFSTAPLIALGCVMMRVCNLDTCPVGIATQNPELRKNFKGDPAHVVNFMKFIASQMREIMSELGVKTIDELVGRVDLLEKDESVLNEKWRTIDLSDILHRVDVPKDYGMYCSQKQEHNWENSIDRQQLLRICRPALEERKKVVATMPIRNVQRDVGTTLGSVITKRYGENIFQEDTICLTFTGSAGQSFGAFVPAGVTLKLIGDSNDHFGKGLSGGKLIVLPNTSSKFKPYENVIIGNVAFYGATSGKSFVSGVAGERFCVRNSGVKVVVEGVGDHACEYMTGGVVVCIGETGRNFAAGMSGGTAYVLDEKNSLRDSCNKELVELLPLTDQEDVSLIKDLLEEHIEYTKSNKAQTILNNWDDYKLKFIKVLPKEFARMRRAIREASLDGLSYEEASLKAFESLK